MIPDREELRLIDFTEDPQDWPKIKVIPHGGNPVWKHISDIEEEDYIPLRKDGAPYQMVRNPGRPKTDDENPIPPMSADASEVSRYRVAERLRLKEAAISTDPLVQTVRADIDSSDILQMSIIAFAEEQAALKYDRITAEREGEAGSPYSMRRIKALETLMTSWMKRKTMIESTSVDLESKAFGVVFQFIVQSFQEALVKADVEEETLNAILSNFVNIVKEDEWKIEAKSRISNMNR